MLPRIALSRDPPAPAAACPEAAAAYAAFQREARAAMILANLVFDQHSTWSAASQYTSSKQPRREIWKTAFGYDCGESLVERSGKWARQDLHEL